MKSFVKVLISVLALGVMASAPLLRAQEEKAPSAEGGKKGGRGRGPMMSAERVEQIVGTLTAEQKTKIADIIKADVPAQGSTREERMEKMQAMNKDIRAVLTPEQQKKWDDRPMGGPGGKGGKKKQN